MSRIRVFTPLRFFGLALLAALIVSCGKSEREPGASRHATHGVTPQDVSAPHPSHEEHVAPEVNRAEEKSPQTQPDRMLYHCPMHPEYRSEKPGNCPICGMNLVPVRREPAPPDMGAAPDSTIHISPARLQTIGVTFGEAAYRDLRKDLRVVGRITYDETRLREINTKFSGWIEELYVDFTGKMVQKGEPLFSLYSPELVEAQEEYLLALSVADRAPTALQAARRKLAFLDLTNEQLEKLEESRIPTRTLTISSPVTGFVVEKNVVAGTFVEPGQTLYRVADISTVWLIASVYEQDLPHLTPGVQVVAELPLPGGRVTGRVSYIDPYLDEMSRTARVRVALVNTDLQLRPETYATVLLHVELGPRLSVPAAAVLFSGKRRMVFVDRGGGKLEPREIRVGASAGEIVEVLSGLEPGEKVVTSANFLIDSESRLQAALSKTHSH